MKSPGSICTQLKVLLSREKINCSSRTLPRVIVMWRWTKRDESPRRGRLGRSSHAFAFCERSIDRSIERSADVNWCRRAFVTSRQPAAICQDRARSEWRSAIRRAVHRRDATQRLWSRIHNYASQFEATVDYNLRAPSLLIDESPAIEYVKKSCNRCPVSVPYYSLA